MHSNDPFNNILILTDSYKVTHWKQYPVDTTVIYSFLESRGGVFPTTTFFGLQYILKRYLEGQVVTMAKIDEAEAFFLEHFGKPVFNRAGWERIVTVHDGYLPVVIKAVPEGTTVGTHNILMSVENTDPQMPWLTNYIETLLTTVWYPTTVCTRSRAMRAVIAEHLEATGTPADIDFKLHDFGFRGSTSVESSAIGGAAHLVNFKGTDTMSALMLLRKFYSESMAGFSIPASEHSTITSWGRENEVAAMRNMLEQYPTGLMACVSDSYNIFDACTKLWGGALKDRVLSRDGVLVVRPDSGPIPATPVEVIRLLGEAFGTTYNTKGARVLHPKVRVIQGDGIDINTMGDILVALKDAGYSSDNIAFGSGGGLLQTVNRDTCKFAFKAAARHNGSDWVDVYKDPITDPGKTSKAGRMSLVARNGVLTTVSGVGLDDQLQVVFDRGYVPRIQTLADVRSRARVGE